MSKKAHEPCGEPDLFSAAGLREHAGPIAGKPKFPPPEAKHSESIEQETVKPPSGELAPNERYLRDTEIAQRYAVCRQTVWRWAALNRLPKPVKLSEGVTRWCLSDLLAHEISVRSQPKADARRPRRIKGSKSVERQ